MASFVASNCADRDETGTSERPRKNMERTVPVRNGEQRCAIGRSGRCGHFRTSCRALPFAARPRDPYAGHATRHILNLPTHHVKPVTERYRRLSSDACSLLTSRRLPELDGRARLGAIMLQKSGHLSRQLQMRWGRYDPGDQRRISSTGRSVRRGTHHERLSRHLIQVQRY